jgi:hypothetical protein
MAEAQISYWVWGGRAGYPVNRIRAVSPEAAADRYAKEKALNTGDWVHVALEADRSFQLGLRS